MEGRGLKLAHRGPRPCHLPRLLLLPTIQMAPSRRENGVSCRWISFIPNRMAKRKSTGLIKETERKEAMDTRPTGRIITRLQQKNTSPRKVSKKSCTRPAKGRHPKTPRGQRARTHANDACRTMKLPVQQRDNCRVGPWRTP